MRVLTVNAGSSSLKLSLLAPAENGGDNTMVARAENAGDEIKLAATELEMSGGGIDLGRLREALDSPLGQADAVGHRIVHGGEHFREAVEIDANVEAKLRELVELAPLQQPKSLTALDQVRKLLPDLPSVACFDTAFHSTIPPAATTYALPADWRKRFGLRRYGFHGLSHSWVARRVPRLLGSTESDLRIVSCHLGAGASLCGISSGVSLDTTMGFTPLEGLVMATRCGTVDPGLLLWLLERAEVSPEELADALEHRSGLLGLAGSADMAEVVRRAELKDGAASLGLDVYIHRLCASIAAMAAALGGLDVLAFTGGVGENCAEVRTRAAAGVAFLGVHIDEAHNNEHNGVRGDREVGSDGSAVRTVVLAAREDLEIARQVRALLTRQMRQRR